MLYVKLIIYLGERSFSKMSEQQKHTLTRRDMLRLTGTAGVGLLAAACVPAQTVVEKETIVTVEVEKIVEVEKAPGDEAVQVDGALWVLQKKDFHPDYNDYLRNEISAYAASQDWPLDISYIAGFSSGTGDIEKLAAAVQSGNPPDLVDHDGFSVPQLRNLYIVQPVSDVVEEVEAAFGPAAPYLKQIHFIEGQWWLIPYHQRAGGGYYRRDIFDAAGIDVQEIRRYDVLRDATLEVSNPDEEMYGWGITVNRSGDGNSIINRIKTGWGAAWQDETGQYIRTNSPEMVEAMEFIRSTYLDEKYQPMLPPGVLAWNDISNNEAYLGSKIAYTENAGTVYAKAVVDQNPVADSTNYLAQPGGPVIEEFQVIGSKNWHILRGAANTAAAKQLVLEFTANLDRYDAMLESSPAYALPAYTDLWEMSSFIQSSEIALQAKPAALDPSGIDATVYPGPPSAAISAIDQGGIWNDMVNSIMTGTDVAEAVADAHDRMVLVFQEFGLPGEEG
jgi:multiple sugar transport system substrate-binding protein